MPIVLAAYTEAMFLDHTKPLHVAIVGATGVVGRELLALLAQRNSLPIARVLLLASDRSSGVTIEHAGDSIIVQPLQHASDFDDIDIAFFCAGGDISRQFAPLAVERGALVIDNSSAFRMQPDVPLIVPEVNGDALKNINSPCVIANPNCSTIVALLAVGPLHRAVGVSRMVVATYQAASGGGAAMMKQLEVQMRRFATGQPIAADGERQLALNVFTHESSVNDDGSNEEEAKLVRETHRILSDATIGITATCVRVPVLRAHSEAINLTMRESLNESDARDLLMQAPGVRVVDERMGDSGRFPEPIHATGCDEILVGRIRSDASQPSGLGLNLWVSGDQLRKGAALNALQIAEMIHNNVLSQPPTHISNTA